MFCQMLFCQPCLTRSENYKLIRQMNNFNEAYHTQDSLLMYESDGLETKIENDAKKTDVNEKLAGVSTS